MKRFIWRKKSTSLDSIFWENGTVSRADATRVFSVLFKSFEKNLSPSFQNRIDVHGNWLSSRHEKLNTIWFELSSLLQKPYKVEYMSILTEEENLSFSQLLHNLKEGTLETLFDGLPGYFSFLSPWILVKEFIRNKRIDYVHRKYKCELMIFHSKTIQIFKESKIHIPIVIQHLISEYLVSFRHYPMKIKSCDSEPNPHDVGLTTSFFWTSLLQHSTETNIE